MSTKPGVALQDVRFEERPHIVRRGGELFLRYRLAAGPDDKPNLRMVVGATRSGDAGFYFFIGPISNPERGNVIERSLASDRLTDCAQTGGLHWLNPDGTRIPLEIRDHVPTK
jgi:hypothetical protein